MGGERDKERRNPNLMVSKAKCSGNPEIRVEQQRLIASFKLAHTVPLNKQQLGPENRTGALSEFVLPSWDLHWGIDRQFKGCSKQIVECYPRHWLDPSPYIFLSGQTCPGPQSTTIILFYGYTVQVPFPPPVSPPVDNNPYTAAIATQHTKTSLAVFLLEPPAPTEL